MTTGLKVGAGLVAIYLLATSIAAFYLLCKVWPGAADPGCAFNTTACAVSVFNSEIKLTLELRQILVAFFAGMMGNTIASTLSFSSYVGNRKLELSWLPWYFFNPLAGALIATLFYFLYRGGMVSAGTPGAAISAYTIAGLGGLAGMFSKNAADKMKEVFDTVFRSRQDEQRKDKLGGPAAHATAQPATIAHGAAAATEVILSGATFSNACTATVNGTARTARFISATSVGVTLTVADLAAAGNVVIIVRNADSSTVEATVVVT
jgi:hypothetical protein